MGNCLHRVEPSFSLDKNRSQFFLSDYNGNFSYEDNGSYEFPDDYSMDLAAPCHSCHLLDESSLPFFILTSVLGVLASGAVLFALLRPLFHWQICPGWPILAQLAVGSALFSTAVPILAPGLSNAHNSALCGLGYWRSGGFEVHACCNLFYRLHPVASGDFGSQGADKVTGHGTSPLG
uniref:Atypical chemokine receptor 1 n=1 Tax=Jaculus jaculus TaxID=51337 RepID=A0A8C5LB27_JACJA